MKLMLKIVVCLVVINCKQSTNKTNINGTKIEINHAKGFSVTDFKSYKVLTIHTPWNDSDTELRYALVPENIQFKNSEAFDAVISVPIKTIVATSTTHLPALDLLRVTNTLIGFPNTSHISSPVLRERVNNGFITEVGKNEALNTETILNMRPDLIMAFSINGANKTLNTINQANIPVIYNGDWLEQSPLAKAEWIKVFGLLYNKQTVADSIYNAITQNYNAAKQLALKAKNKPTILSGAMHNDIWYLPSGTSTEAQLLKDANTTYLWADTKGSGSLALSFESVFEMAQNADIWFSPGHYKSLQELSKANQHYAKFKSYKNNNIYSFANTTGETGGVIYYELGSLRPDLILKDLIKYAHPELLNNYTPSFYKPIN